MPANIHRKLKYQEQTHSHAKKFLCKIITMPFLLINIVVSRRRTCTLAFTKVSGEPLYCRLLCYRIIKLLIKILPVWWFPMGVPRPLLMSYMPIALFWYMYFLIYTIINSQRLNIKLTTRIFRMLLNVK